MIEAPQATANLNDDVAPSERVNHKRVQRVMREHGIGGYKEGAGAADRPLSCDDHSGDLLV